ncbi:hypothetical protein PIB30_081823 [Stylosanthes scabra]|uniref:Transposase n=1 Tax=Stylosanthes scabra TaxID=79078 RepID=A0ABU6WRK6_9FABA|nr:hypothetical protein [Stylosanthes scabra]
MQERQDDEFPFAGFEREAPQSEEGILEQEGSHKGNSKAMLRATTIDEFLKEQGIDVELEGLIHDEQSTELNADEGDTLALDKDYSMFVMADIIDDEGDKRNKKKTHGKTNCNDIYGRTMEQREEVTFYMGQPVGPTTQSVSNLTSFLGTMGRNKRVVSLLYTNWIAVPPEKKKFIWAYTNTKFILPTSTEKWVIQTARDAWKRFKTKIKCKHFHPYENVEDMVKNRPKQVPPSEFIRLVLYWSHPLIQSISEKNEEHSLQHKFPHRMGPINFARVRADMGEASGTNEEPKRFEVFIATRTNRKRKEPDEAIQQAIEAFESRQASGETEEEAFQSLFGKERQIGTVLTQQQQQATQQQQQAEEIHGLRKMVKLLLLRSEPDMRLEKLRLCCKMRNTLRLMQIVLTVQLMFQTWVW